MRPIRWLRSTMHFERNTVGRRRRLFQKQDPLSRGIPTNIIVQSGEPVLQIADETSNTSYDLAVIGARWIGATGRYWRSEKTYEVIKSIQADL